MADLVQLELNELEYLAELVHQRDMLNVLDPNWVVYDNQIKEYTKELYKETVCILDKKIYSLKLLLETIDLKTASHLMALSRLCPHYEVEFNYGYIQIVFKIQMMDGSNITFHPNKSNIKESILDVIKFDGVAIISFVGLDLQGHHLMMIFNTENNITIKEGEIE